MSIKVAIVEDDRATLAEYVAALAAESDFRVVGCCESVKTALEALPAAKPDVVLMDIQFPVSSGIECTRELKEQLPDIAVLMLTVVEDDADVFAAILAGADGYILKSASIGELTRAIHDVANDSSPVTPVIARKVLRYIQGCSEESTELTSLSAREREILQLIAQGHKDADIAVSLDLSPHTVGNYIRRIFRKLHVHCRAEAVSKLRPAHGIPRLPKR